MLREKDQQRERLKELRVFYASGRLGRRTATPQERAAHDRLAKLKKEQEEARGRLGKLLLLRRLRASPGV